jgi:RecA/RadA recombinase
MAKTPKKTKKVPKTLKTPKKEPKAKKSKKKKEPWSVRNTMDDIADKLEKKYKENALSLNEDIVETRIPSGSLAVDLIIGGGIPVGRWITLYGQESSGKSTLTYIFVRAMIEAGVSVKQFYDYESSLATNYFSNIVGLPLDKILGKKNDDGEWIVKPIVRHYMPEYGEKMFHMVSSKLEKMPDVVKVKKENYLRFTEKQAKEYKIPKENVAFTKERYIYVPDDGPPIKYAIFVDSYPEMLPEALLNDPTKNPMAMQARMFSQNIPLLRPRLRMKGATLIGVNHTRLKPMVQYGSPEYAPCGEHLKLATDIRFRVSQVAIPHGKGRIEEEYNLDGGLERFQYMKLVTKKNKTFPKEKECLLRICLEVDGKSGYGVDPVWDLFEYLKRTGQIAKRGDKVTIKMVGPWQDVKLSWDDFKGIVHKPTSKGLLYKVSDHESIRKALKKKSKPAKIKALRKAMDIRGACRKQLSTGDAFALTIKAVKDGEEEATE